MTRLRDPGARKFNRRSANLAQAVSFLILLTLALTSTPNAAGQQFHHHFGHSGNPPVPPSPPQPPNLSGPFVVAGFCGSSSAQWAPVGKTLAIQVNNPGGYSCGAQIYNSVPGSNSGAPSATSGTIPSGTYSFTVSNLSTTVNSVYSVANVTPGGIENVPVLEAPLTNGTFSFSVPSGIAGVSLFIFRSSFLPVTCSLTNFKQNNTAIPADTTQTATSTTSFYGFCGE